MTLTEWLENRGADKATAVAVAAGTMTFKGSWRASRWAVRGGRRANHHPACGVTCQRWVDGAGWMDAGRVDGPEWDALARAV
jgi:hypothetical protein